ncbi:MAG: DMT family transporter [Flavobacteriales bacterium]
MIDKRLRPHIFLLLGALIYGSTAPIARCAMPDYVKPFGFIALRNFGAMIFFQLLSLFFKGKRSKVDRSDWPALILCSAFGTALNQLTIFYGLSLTSPITESIIITTSPICIMLLSIAFFKKVSVTRLNVLGVLVGFFGALLLVLYDKPDARIATDPIWGNLMVLVGVVSFSLYFISVKRLMQKYSGIEVARYLFTFGFFLVLPFSYKEVDQIHWHDLPPAAILSILYVVIALSCLAYLLDLLALREVDAHVAGAYAYFEPGFATFFAILLGKDSMSLVKLTAMLLIFLGVYLVTRKSGKLKNIPNP